MQNSVEKSLYLGLRIFFMIACLLLAKPYFPQAQTIEIIPVDTVGSVGTSCILKIDLNGTPHILYYDLTNQRLKHAKKQMIIGKFRHWISHIVLTILK